MTILRVHLTPEITSDLTLNTIFTPKSSLTRSLPSKSSFSDNSSPTSSPTAKSGPPDSHVVTGSEEEIFEICKTILLEPGGLIVIPTETVYGLAGNIHLDESILRIFKIKERPLDDPLIVHVHSFLYALRNLYNTNIVESFIILFLARKFAPGPLTIVARRGDVSSLLTSGSEFIAVRCPNNRKTLKLLEFCEIPLAAPSANKFGHISPTCPEHVQSEFPTEDLHILDDGNCPIGIESTIIKVQSNDNDYYYHNSSHSNLSGNPRSSHSNLSGNPRSSHSNPGSSHGNPNHINSASNLDVFEMMLKLIERNYSSVDQKFGPGYRINPYENYFGDFTNCTARIELLRKGSITLRDISNALARFPNIQISDQTDPINVEIVPDSSSSGSSPRITHTINSTVHISPRLTHSNSTINSTIVNSSVVGNSTILGSSHQTMDYPGQYSLDSSNTNTSNLGSPRLTSTISSKLSTSNLGTIGNLGTPGTPVNSRLGTLMPGMMTSHYAPLVPTYMIEIIETQVNNRTEFLKGTSKNSTVTGDLTYNLNFDYEEVNCSNIILIDIGNYFRKYSHLFCLYLPLGTEPTQVANKLYSSLRRAELKANSTDSPVIQSNSIQSNSIKSTVTQSTGTHSDGIKSTGTQSTVVKLRNPRKMIAINFGVSNEDLFSAVYDRIQRASAGKVIYLHHVKNAIKFLLY